MTGKERVERLKDRMNQLETRIRALEAQNTFLVRRLADVTFPAFMRAMNEQAQEQAREQARERKEAKT